jgi:hypothetical protein
MTNDKQKLEEALDIVRIKAVKIFSHFRHEPNTPIKFARVFAENTGSYVGNFKVKETIGKGVDNIANGFYVISKYKEDDSTGLFLYVGTGHNGLDKVSALEIGAFGYNGADSVKPVLGRSMHDKTFSFIDAGSNLNINGKGDYKSILKKISKEIKKQGR